MSEPLTVGVIGPGRLGVTLGRRWATSGHTVRYGVRDPEHARHQPVRDHAAVTQIAAAVTGVDLVLLAVPWPAALEVAGQLAEAEVDAVVVDATNPLAGRRGHDRDPDASGAEMIAARVPGAHVVKAFNTTGVGNLATVRGYPIRPMMLLAGDDQPAKQLVARLVTQLGLEPVDAGDLAAARDLEHLAMVWIRLAYTLGHGPDISLALQRRRVRDTFVGDPGLGW